MDISIAHVLVVVNYATDSIVCLCNDQATSTAGIGRFVRVLTASVHIEYQHYCDQECLGQNELRNLCLLLELC